MTSFRHFAALTALSAAFVAGQAAARDQIRIVGSSTVFPYTQAVAEEFRTKTGGKAPVVESTGTGGGMKIFCGGVGVGHPDITGASRAMKKSEFELCAQNGVTDITEAKIGYDGLSFARARKGQPAVSFTKTQLWLALSAKVPVKGAMVDNPYKKWSDIDPKLPNIAINVFGPPPTSGTRDAWVELVMDAGCEAHEFVKAQKATLSKDDFGKFVKDNCQRMRQDGPFVEAGENDNLIVQRLEADPNAFGIFGYSFLYENEDKIEGLAIEGVKPTAESIADGSYKVSRPLYVYFKNAHRGVIKGLNEFIAEYASTAALGAEGYLTERGLTPLPAAELKATQAAMTGAAKMAAPAK